MMSGYRVSRAFVIPVSVFLSVALALLFAWSAVKNEWRRNVDQQVDLTLTQASLRLQDYVHARIRAIELIGAYLSTEVTNFDQAFRSRSLILQQSFGGFQALNWVSVEGTIEVVVPEEHNAAAVGRNVLRHPQAGAFFRQARETREARLTDPLVLFQGGQGLAAYLPVVKHGVLVGFLNPVFRVRPLIENALGAGVLDSHDLRIRDGETVFFESGNFKAQPERTNRGSSAKILNRDWTIAGRPNRALWATMLAGRPEMAFVLSLFMAAGLSWLLRGALLRNMQRAQEERQRQTLQLELERSGKMSALGRLAGGVAHDFNNILTAIVGNAELIKITTDDEATTHEFAQDIISASERASDLTRQLLVFSNQDLTENTQVDLNAEVHQMHSLLRRLLSESISLDFDLDEGLLPVAANRGQISQLVVNLAVNASDAMPEGGQISIATRKEDEPSTDTLLGRSWVIVSVGDTGEGMDEVTQRRIFEPFYSSKDRGEHGGLGLATVYGIVQTLGGQLKLTSELGSGSEFEIWLPATAGPVATSELPKSVVLGSPLHVLFVEDDGR